MKRRHVLTALCASPVAWTLPARAQPAPARIGYLPPGTPQSHGAYLPTFLRGLAEDRLVEGRDFTIDLRYAEGHLDRVPAIVAELIAEPVAVLVVGSTIAGLAAKRATTRIPVVFVGGDEPVSAGLVDSLGHPGGNVTGISLYSTEIMGKRLDMLMGLLPSYTGVVGVLLNPVNPNGQADARQLSEVVQQRGRQLAIYEASDDKGIDAAFADMEGKQIVELIVSSDPFLNARRQKIVDLSARQRIVTNYPQREYVVAGGLFSHGVRYADAYRQAGVYAGRILGGTNPADLPVLQPTAFELVLNMTAAKAIGLDPGASLLAGADEIVE